MAPFLEVLTIAISLLTTSFALPNPEPQPELPIIRREIDTGIPRDPNFLPVPTEDSWYAPPIGWEAAPPGAPLKVRTSPYTRINIINATDTFQILFRSSDTHGDPSWSVVTVFVPWSHTTFCSEENPDGCSHGIVSQLIPYDSACLDASPSYLLQWGEKFGESMELLTRGWFVAVPDYEGPHASYGDGPQAGYMVLDAARAVQEIAPSFGLRQDKLTYAVWGYSGGAMAAQFAAEMHASYAPELKIDGFAIGGTSPNLTTSGLLMNGHDTAGLVVASVVGLTSQHPKERAWVEQQMKEEGYYNITGFFTSLILSGRGALDFYAYHDIAQYFKRGDRDAWGPELQALFDSQGAMGYHGVPKAPVFLYKPIQDEMSPISETDDLYRRLCDQGAHILYHRNSIGGHNQELWTGRIRALEFFHTVLDGMEFESVVIPEEGYCAMYNLSIPLDGTKLRKGDGSTLA